jgi:hypothetical protein
MRPLLRDLPFEFLRCTGRARRPNGLQRALHNRRALCRIWMDACAELRSDDHRLAACWDQEDGVTDSWGPVIAVLVAVLIGALIPVLLQLRATLRAMERTMLRSGPAIDELLRATTTAARTIDTLGAQGGHLGRLASAMGAAVGPALTAGLAALLRARPATSARRSPRQVDFKHIQPQSRKWARA